MRAYTNLDQSMKLAKILPIESADMHYIKHPIEKYYSHIPLIGKYSKIQDEMPCWSLGALLSLMICPRLEEYIKGIWYLTTFIDETLRTPIEIQDSKDPIDACVAMIEKLHELKML